MPNKILYIPRKYQSNMFADGGLTDFGRRAKSWYVKQENENIYNSQHNQIPWQNVDYSQIGNTLPEVKVSPSMYDLNTSARMQEAIPDPAIRNQFYDYLTYNGNEGMYNPAFDVNLSDKGRSDRFLELYDKASKPTIRLMDKDKNNNWENTMPDGHTSRAFYDWSNTMHLGDDDHSGSPLLAELSHAYQFYSPTSVKNWLAPSNHKIEAQGDNDAVDKYGLDGYERLGNMEFNAHEIIEPVMSNYILGNTKEGPDTHSFNTFEDALKNYTRQVVKSYRQPGFEHYEDPYSSFRLDDKDKSSGRVLEDLYSQEALKDVEPLDFNLKKYDPNIITPKMMRALMNPNLMKEDAKKQAYGGNLYKKGGPKRTYKAWKAAIKQHKGIDIDNDNTYDYRGYYVDNPNAAWDMLNKDSDAHFTDEYKLPLHPTFSEESKHSHPPYIQGGRWSERPSSMRQQWNYQFSPTQVATGKMVDEVIDYASDAENDGFYVTDSRGRYPIINGTVEGRVLPNVEVEPTYYPKREYAEGGPLNTRKNWDTLSMKEKREMMRVAISNGITNLSEIKDRYNEFAQGGHIYKKGGSKRNGGIGYNASVQKAMQFFMNKGLTQYQAAGLVGNLMRESGLQIGAVNPSSGAYGIAQWLGSRKSNLFARYGKNPTLDQQLDYVWHELNSTHRNGLKWIKNSKDAAEAARNAFGYYEFSAGPEGAIAAMNKSNQNGTLALNRGIEFASNIMGVPYNSNAIEQTDVSVQQEVPAMDIPFDPSNPDAFFNPSAAMNPIVIVQSPKFSEEEIAEANRKREELQKMRDEQDRLNKMNMAFSLVSSIGSQNDNSSPYSTVLGMLTNNPYQNLLNIAAEGGKLYALGGDDDVINRMYDSDTGEVGNITGINDSGSYIVQYPSGIRNMNLQLPEVEVIGKNFKSSEQQLSDLHNTSLQKQVPVSTYVSSKTYPNLDFNIGSEEEAVKRANHVYSNYSDAKDNPLSSAQETVYNGLRFLKDNIWEGIPSGVSNCTLTATQWVDPTNPIKNASSIFLSPNKYNYTRINEEEAIPGNLVIAKNPNSDSYHTMMITGFAPNDGVYDFDGKKYSYKKGEPLMTYSRGGHDDSFIRSNIPLSVYTANSDGHTDNYYYRYNYPDRVVIPDVKVFP